MGLFGAESRYDRLKVSASSHYGSKKDDNCFDLEICPDLLLAGLAAFATAAFFLLYQAITMAAEAQMMGGGRQGGRKFKGRSKRAAQMPAKGLSILERVQIGTG